MASGEPFSKPSVYDERGFEGLRMNLTRNILTTLSARIIVLGIALVSSMVLARALGPEGRGLFALVLLLPELATSFALLGFEQANAVYAGLEPGGRRALVWQSAVTACVTGGLITLGGVYYVSLGAPGFHSLLRGPLWLYIVPLALVPGRVLMQYWGAVLRGMNRIFLLNLIEVRHEGCFTRLGPRVRRRTGGGSDGGRLG